MLVAQWSARASPKGNDGGSNPSGHPSLLSSVVERNTLDIVVVGSIPTGDTSLVSSVRQSIGLLIRGSRVQAPHEVQSLFQDVK